MCTPSPCQEKGATMRMTRRRFIAISAAAGLVGPASALDRNTWSGRALGAEATITLLGLPAKTQPALEAAIGTLRRLEAQFSLYDSRSVLSKLNANGHAIVPPEFSALMTKTAQAHRQTQGLFDPTIQPLWQALALSPDMDDLQHSALLNLVDWNNVRHETNTVSFAKPNMAITLNGIAQGFVTDRVTAVLRAHGFKDTLVNVGEFSVGDTSTKMTVAEADGTPIKSLDLRGSAIATSSPNALQLSENTGHIIHPRIDRAPSVWKTISVVADTACFADAYSTALCLAPDTRLARRLISHNQARLIILQDTKGNLTTLGA